MSFHRQLVLDLPPEQSAFLWGARQTGKSTLLRQRFPDSVHIDLLDSDQMLALSARPARLGEMKPSCATPPPLPGSSTACASVMANC